MSLPHNDARELADKALRTPDLEWAHDLVHGLANALLASLAREQTERAKIERAIELLLEHSGSLDPDSFVNEVIDVLSARESGKEEVT